jgi:hypothetical protein
MKEKRTFDLMKIRSYDSGRMSPVRNNRAKAPYDVLVLIYGT